MEKGAKSYTCSDTTFLPLKVQNSTERARIHTLYDSVGTLPCLCKYNSIGSLFYGHLKRLLHTYYITTITSYNRDTRGLLGLWTRPCELFRLAPVCPGLARFAPEICPGLPRFAPVCPGCPENLPWLSRKLLNMT